MEGTALVCTALHCPASVPVVILLGQPLIVGSSLSSTVIVKEQDAVFPEPSVAVYVTVVVPTLKDAPLAGPEVSEALAPEQLSFTEGVVYVTVAAHVPLAALTVWLEGQEIVGF